VKLLVLDNYDSFTYNLVHLIEKVSDIEFEVIRNDKISIKSVNSYDKILLSPGPGLPKDAGIMPELINCYKTTKSILGVCLGLQAIGESYGSSLKNLDTVVHGIATPIDIIETDPFLKTVLKPLTLARYHSWVINPYTLPSELIITAKDKTENIMAIKHKTHDVRAVQFHPESILSEYGETILKNWIES
jgi:anthranilate synthase component 2